jgi:murein DD-endopeptidase MepM/ murein hydrolase activator NlpD
MIFIFAVIAALFGQHPLGSPAVGQRPAVELRPALGSWVSPLAGSPVVVRPFDPPTAGQPWLPGNRGVDLAAPVGASVRSAGAGVVSFAGPLAGRGVVVVVHGSLRTTYEPVLARVTVGDVVRAGEQIGVLQAAPSPCGQRPCLHWGLLRGDEYLNPMLLLSPAVRLLPQGGAATVGGLALTLRPGPASRPASRAASRSARRACLAAEGRPSGASGRCATRSPRALGRSPPA